MDGVCAPNIALYAAWLHNAASYCEDDTYLYAGKGLYMMGMNLNRKDKIRPLT